MTVSTMLQGAPASNSRGKLAFKVFLWLLALVVLSAAWFILLASLTPARLDFSSGGAGLMASTPPVLLTFLCWTGMRIFSTPRTVPAATQVNNAPPTAPEPLVSARFQIGAWSVLTPHGNVIETVEGTKARSKVFKPDKLISDPSGYPVHTGIINGLDLEAMGHPAGTRERAPRVMTMLCVILNDLHTQQATLTDTIDGPANVYWLLPHALTPGDDARGAIFAAAWKRSAWHESTYQLHMIPANEVSAFNVLLSLQDGIEHSSIPYTIIIAADSLLDREELAPALALGQVFSHTAPQGFIPSEGAGGILLFNPASTSDELWAYAAIMGPVKSFDRVTYQDGLGGAMAAALAGAGKGAADIVIVVSDADHRIGGSMEVINATTHILAHVDPMEQRISPMEYAGAFGAASDLIHIALAVELAGEKSVFALSTFGGQCAAVVISPA